MYTGRDVRSSLNTSKRVTKTGLFDMELNRMSKVLFLILILASIVLVSFKGFSKLWIIYFSRFVLLLSSIIPISLRVNLDLAKAFYSYTISHDPKLSTTVVRNSSIPEELGRIDFLLTDKTGTLTQNEMIFKKLHIGRIQFGCESLGEISEHLRSSFESAPSSSVPRRRLEVWEVLQRTVLGLAICHNVTPIRSELEDEVNILIICNKLDWFLFFVSSFHHLDPLLLFLSFFFTSLIICPPVRSHSRQLLRMRLRSSNSYRLWAFSCWNEPIRNYL